MKIAVHYPKTQAEQAELDARVAKFHAEFVVRYIEGLRCSAEQKQRLIDAVVQTVLEDAEKRGK